MSIFYAPYWLQCPLASEAAVNDLEFHRAMMNYSSVDEEVAEAARHAFLRHRWYLTAVNTTGIVLSATARHRI